MNIQKKFILITLIFLVCFPQLYAAVDINIYIEPEFSIGNTVAFNYTIESSTSQNITYTSWIECPTAPIPMLEIKMATLEPGIILYESGNYLYISEDIEPQECTAYVAISNPVHQTVSKIFTLNTNPSFNFEIIINKKVYSLGEEVNIDYISNIESPLINAKLIYPDKSVQQIILPYAFKANSIGNYYIESNASKEGYKSISTIEQFGVIEEDVIIEYTELNKDEEEKKQDLDSQNIKNKVFSNVADKYPIYFLIGILLIIVFFFFIKIFKRKSLPLN